MYRYTQVRSGIPRADSNLVIEYIRKSRHKMEIRGN